jgi:excisionase family DNA binding protein
VAEAAYVSTAQVSQALGVGVTTVKRWVDSGILPAYRTAGGHRKLLLADVLRLVRENEFPRLDLTLLGAATPSRGRVDAGEASRDLYSVLRRGDAEAARALIEGAYRNGISAAKLADTLITPAMHRIGAEWAAGRLDVMHEHRATQICSESLYALKSRLVAQALRDRPLAVGGAPEGHLHALASQLIELVLLEAGWVPVNLGPNTPFSSFRKALSEMQPRLLWLSINPVHEPEAFLASYRSLYDDAHRAGIPVAIGGIGLTEELRAVMPYTTYGDGLTHLADFASSLHPRPRRRPRGRPRGSSAQK